MAWFTYKCKVCGYEFRKVLDERVPTVPCELSDTCQGEAAPVLKPCHVKIVEQLDNGVMVRKVERLHNIEEILEERSDRHGGTDQNE